MKIIITIMAILFCVVLALGFSTDQFNNSLTEENITFTGNENFTRWLSIPSGIYLGNAFLNLIGYINGTSTTTYEEEDGFYSTGSFDGSQPASLAVDEDFGTYARCLDNSGVCVVYENHSIGLGALEYNWSAKYFIGWCGGGGGQYIDVQCYNYSSSSFDQFYYVQDLRCSPWSPNTELPTGCTSQSPVQIRTETTDVDAPNFQGYIYEGSLLVRNYSYPENPALYINETLVWNITGSLNSSNSPVQTNNFFVAINNYLSICNYVADVCDIPFIFHSDNPGDLEYSNLIFNGTLQTITAGTSCEAGYSLAQNYTLKDEENLTVTNGTIAYNIVYGYGENNTQLNLFGEVEDSNTLHICINSTFLNNYSLDYGEIQYTAPGYVDRRYYNYDGVALTNATQNITLYSLLSASQTSFKLEVEDTSLNPYINKYTSLIRWYPDLDEYNVVDMGLTDEYGSTVIHVRTEDVDYRIGVNERNGTLIKLAEPIRMTCLISPCTYTLKIAPTEIDYIDFLNIDYTFDYNFTTGIWTFIFSDDSQETSEINLTVYRVTGTSVYPVCSNLLSASSGAVTCNTSLYTGTLRGVVIRSASPGVELAQKIITTTSTAFSSTFGLWISLLIGIPIIFIFAFMSPLGAVLGGIIALIPALYLGAISWTVLGGIAILGGIVMHFLKRIN